MYVFTQKVASAPTLTLALTAEERTRSRYRYRIPREITGSGDSATLIPASPPEDLTLQSQELYLQMPRGTVFQDGDCLAGEEHDQVLKIVAQPEPVVTVRGLEIELLRAAYHLGNRHVPLEVGADYLRLSPDPVLESMLAQLGMAVSAETAPFQPESGAYGHHH